MDDAGLPLTPWRDAVDRRLGELLPPGGPSDPLVDCGRYALLAPGKRLRPLLTLTACAHFGGEPLEALDTACAFEMVHAASLILDDLPCMDDAALRRGRPTAHLAYGQDVAILAAVALLSRAFGVVASCGALGPAARASLVRRLSETVSFEGLSAGQALDLRERSVVQAGPLEQLNHRKTGVLFALAAEAGACAAGTGGREAAAASNFGSHLGAAFQVRDDLLDVEGDTAALGKDIDQDRDKATFVTVLGRDGARRRVAEEIAAAGAALRGVGASGPLDRLAQAMFALAPA
jgi:geranylgeranyl diphosphate synthase type II